MSNKIDFSKLKVEILLRNKGDMIGMAAIEYAGMRVTHFRFMKNKETGEIYVNFPALKVWKTYQTVFWVINDEDYENFEGLLKKKFFEFRESVKKGEIADNTPLGEINFKTETL